MTSERIQRQIDRLLDEAEDAVSRSEWAFVHDRAQNALAFDPENQDALAFLAITERALGSANTSTYEQAVAATVSAVPSSTPSQPGPTSFFESRYQAQRFLGEGGKKMVCHAQDTLLDRDVAFALIKTDEIDDVSRTQVSCGTHAMNRSSKSHQFLTCQFVALTRTLRWGLPSISR